MELSHIFRKTDTATKKYSIAANLLPAQYLLSRTMPTITQREFHGSLTLLNFAADMKGQFHFTKHQ